PEKAHATQAQPGANAVKPQERPAKQPGAMKERRTTNEHGATNEPGAGKGHKTPAHQESATSPKSNVSGESADMATPNERQKRIEERRKGMKDPAAAAKTATNPAGAAAGAGAASSVPATGQQNAQVK